MVEESSKEEPVRVINGVLLGCAFLFSWQTHTAAAAVEELVGIATVKRVGFGGCEAEDDYN